MLNRHQIYADITGQICSLVLPRETLLVYPSADAVVVRNATTLHLVNMLAFTEAFPGTQYTSDKITSITMDAGMKLVFAALSSHIAAWTVSDRPVRNTWRLHSTLTLPARSGITGLACQSGILAVTTDEELSAYTLSMENDLLTWSLKWSIPTGNTSMARLSPSLMHIATDSIGDNSIRIHLTSSGRPLQNIRHPLPIRDLAWRESEASYRDEMALFTVTFDSALRIYLPVLDDPQRLQLHATLDIYTCLPYPTLAPILSRLHTRSLASSIVWLSHQTTHSWVEKLKGTSNSHEAAHHRKLLDIQEGSWDMFLRIMPDGSTVLSAVTNIDRRPPTLIHQFVMVHSPPVLPLPTPSDQCLLLSSPLETGLLLANDISLQSYRVDLLRLLDGGNQAFIPAAVSPRMPAGHTAPINNLHRTPDGRGVAVERTGHTEIWSIDSLGTTLSYQMQIPSAEDVLILDHGQIAIAYAEENLHMYTPQGQVATLGVPKLSAMFSINHGHQSTSLVGIGEDSSLIHVSISSASLEIIKNVCLPTSSRPISILPVDPMAWAIPSIAAASLGPGRSRPTQRENVVSIAEDGEISFWALCSDKEGALTGWEKTSSVRTGRNHIRMGRCSSAKKTTLVSAGQDREGEELSIWDSKESEFASGLEFSAYTRPGDQVNDLDWSSTPDGQSILAVGYAHRVEMLCEKRMSYFDEAPAWTVCWTIDISSQIPYEISDSIWLANGAFVIATGHVLSLYSQADVDHRRKDQTNQESLFQHVARSNGPLQDYHPQMLLQLLLWGKVSLVHDIITALSKAVDLRIDGDETGELEFPTVDTARYLMDEEFGIPAQAVQQSSSQRQNVGLFDDDETEDIDTHNGTFSRSMVHHLIKSLEKHPLSSLTDNEHAHLLVLLQTTVEVEEQRRALDANGLRYLISMRSFYILNARSESASGHSLTGRGLDRRERLRYRDMVWAFHSETQEILLQASVAACGGKMSLMDAKALGVFLWLKSLDSVKAHMETVARNQYMIGDTRDPTACSLLYFALGKVKLVHGLWRQAAWHPEQRVMLKFLSNDFSQDRWRTAALKNAYALMSKQRFEYAAAFFLLGGSLKDAANVCIRNLNDFQLAVAVARISEGGEDGPVFQNMLKATIIPKAFKEGNRWLASWAFWLLHRRDLAVRILITPLSDIASLLDPRPTDFGDPHYDDPSLALLFSQLKMKTLQTAKGTSKISGRTEFNFVLQTARVFRRMGCHALALNLVIKWTFERPSMVNHSGQPDQRPSSPLLQRSEVNALMRRQPSVYIDMEVSSAGSTRPATPVEDPSTEAPQVTGGDRAPSPEAARKAGIGNLMKTAKQTAQVPEFDMGSFDF